MNKHPFISIIIPVYNASHFLNKCLSSIQQSAYTSFEIIVVDDGSTDDSVKIAYEYGAKVLTLSKQSGPAAARNYGANEAQGDILLFVDSDIVIKKETIVQVADDFISKPDVAALFGSYDDNPSEHNFSSLYMNLRHHFVHQISNPEAATFWAGCGAIRKEAFLAVNGFDSNKYIKPSIEDIEMGYRLKSMGYRIFLDKNIQVKHLKKWTLLSVIKTDIFNRAIPWTKLILESKDRVNDLNLQVSQKVSTGLLGLGIALLPLSLIQSKLIYGVPLLLLTILMLNYSLFSFFLRRKGIVFTLFAYTMHLLYFFYSGATYTSYWLAYKFRN